jgi:hypothetical protein
VRTGAWQVARKRCLLIKYQGDTRYTAETVVTHDRNEMVRPSGRQAATDSDDS